MPTPTTPPLSLAKTLPRDADVLIIGLSDAGPVGVPEPVERAYQKTYGMGVGELASSLGAKHDTGKRRTLPAAGGGPRVIVVGIGDASPTPEDLRRAAGTGVRQTATLAADRPVAVAVSLGTDEPETVQAVVEGALLGTYRYARISAQEVKPSPISAITVVCPTNVDPRVLVVGQTLARAVLQARDWVNIPPNLLYPASFAEEARALIRDTRITAEVLDEKALARGGYGGILAVGSGSSRPPRLVRLSYAPRGAKHHLALVGKGITFDTGGLNLKPADGMYTMKCDMAGAAAVLAATDAIARLELKVKITAYACLAENMPSDTAYRPSDVLTMYGGKTVENGNCDAEGRLVLADGIARACEDKPDLIVDVATLTGACIVALGEKTAGLMASDDDTADKVLDAAEAAGEDVWQLPIPKEIRPKLESKVADIRSTGEGRGGGALVAAAFLRDFVTGDIAWAHLDIAGPAFADAAPNGHLSSGGTGFGVRTLVTLATDLQG